MMHDKLLYLDTSALAKLVAREPQSAALSALLADWPHRATSAVAALELSRAASCATANPAVHERAQQVIAATHLVTLGATVLARAANVRPPTLSALAAIHLASALELGDALGAMVAYDVVLAGAASAAGVPVLTPGPD